VDLDPELAQRTDCDSKKRVVRAHEIVSYGRRRPVCYSDPPPPFDFAVFGIQVPREELFRRIDGRLDERLEQGLIAEVQGLLDAGVTAERLELLGLEYREVTAHLTGAKTEQQMIDDLRHGIRRFAKRQLTYFRGFPRRGIELTWVGQEDHELVLQHPWVGDAGPAS
jgi:tRNA dimethylallyltransferase